MFIPISRWQPTRTPSPWDGILQATTPGPVCPQRFPVKFRRSRSESTNRTSTPFKPKEMEDGLDNMSKPRLRYLQLVWPLLLRQSEDCLYLNLFVPETKKIDFRDRGEPEFYSYARS